MGGKPLTPRHNGSHSFYAVSADNASGEFQLGC
jgi:polysaccharide biosynthesis protein PelA